MNLDQCNQVYPHQQSSLFYTPNIQFIPLKSNTLQPFTHTNLIVIESGQAALIVDPGSSSESIQQLKDILSRLPSNLTVFLTHHHHDHWDALHLVEEMKPNAIVLAHKKTLQRISTKLKTRALNDGEILQIGAVKLKAMYAPGHTDGHMVLWDPLRR